MKGKGKSRTPLRRPRSEKVTWVMLGILLLGAAVGGVYYVVRLSGDDSPPQPGTAIPRPTVSLGAPPIDAAATLGLPGELPQTVEEFNEEILAVGRLLVRSLPDESEAYSQMAFAHLGVGQHDKAIECWQQALALDETYSPAWLATGALYAEQSENEQAITALRKTIEMAPETEEAYQLLSEVLLREGKAEESREVAQECVGRFPQNYENHFWLGQACLDLGENEEARRCHEEAIRLNPDWTQSYYSLALVCGRLGDRENAKKYRERFAELKSADQEADREKTRSYDDLSSRRQELMKRHIQAGAIQLRCEHLQMAEAHWLRAVKLGPDVAPTREALTLLYQQQGRIGAALQELDELLKLEPDDADHLLQKGRLLFELEDWQEAEAALKQVLASAPNSPEVNMRLAQIHLRTETDLAAALKFAEKAVNSSPSADSLRLLAAIRAQLGDYPGAKAALKQALSITPYDPELRQAYEQLLQME